MPWHLCYVLRPLPGPDVLVSITAGVTLALPLGSINSAQDFETNRID